VEFSGTEFAQREEEGSIAATKNANKKRPAFVWTTGAVDWPGPGSATLQSLKAGCPAPQSSSGLASTAVP